MKDHVAQGSGKNHTLARYSVPISCPRKSCILLTFGHVHINSKYHSFEYPLLMPRRSRIGLVEFAYEIAMPKVMRHSEDKWICNHFILLAAAYLIVNVVHKSAELG